VDEAGSQELIALFRQQPATAVAGVNTLILVGYA
jgi:hypothetical protein